MDIEELLAKYGGSTSAQSISIEQQSTEQGTGIEFNYKFISIKAILSSY